MPSVNIPPLLIVLLCLNSILVDWIKYQREHYSPFWTYALRFFTPPLYLIYFYSVIHINTENGTYVAEAVAPFARIGFILYLIPNFIFLLICLCQNLAGWLQRRGKHE